jgi:hypothetical protein
MRRSTGLALERLEPRALLSTVTSATPGLVASLTAVASKVAGGAQVALTLTETNVSNHLIRVTYGPSNDGFAVSKAGKVFWNENTGQALPMFLQVQNLNPGQSATVHATWDARSNAIDPASPWVEGSPLSGTFTVSDALDDHATATVTIPKAWATPAKSVHAELSPSVHAMTMSLG